MLTESITLARGILELERHVVEVGLSGVQSLASWTVESTSTAKLRVCRRSPPWRLDRRGRRLHRRIVRFQSERILRSVEARRSRP